MAELDTIVVTNPTKDDFTVNFNGEPYFIGKSEQKAFPEFLAFHIAKHLSDKMLGEEVEKLRKEKTDNPYRPRVGQLMVYDNPKRRIALYQIFGDKDKVESCIAAYPFKGFVGEMREYDDFVTKESAKETKAKATADA